MARDINIDFDDQVDDTYAGEPSERMEAIAREARERVAEVMEFESRFREERRVARDFIEQHFTEEELRSRRETQRPALELHPIEARAQEILHDYRKSGTGFRIGSATSEVGDKAAAAFHGLAIRDQRDSLSEAEMEKVALEMVLYGLGIGKWVAVDEDGLEGGEGALFSDTTEEMSEALSLGAFDKRLRLVACDNENVYPDPRDTTLDKSQMSFLIEVERMTLEERNRRFPMAAQKKLPASVFDADDEKDMFWFSHGRTGPSRDREVRVATYYKRYRKQVDYVWTPLFGEHAKREDRLTAQERAQVARAEEVGDVSRFQKEASFIRMHVTDGMFELMDPWTLPFSRIPYFFAMGPVYTFTDGQRAPRGLVHQLRDTNQWMDLTASSAAFKQGIASEDGWIGSAEATRGHANDWNTRRPKTIKLYNEYTTLPGPGGERLKLSPPIYHSSQPALDAAAQMMGVQRELIGVQTGSADPQSRDTTSQMRSGMALKRIDEMAAASRTIFMWNLEKVTARSMGETWLSMARYVYDRPGRLVVISATQSRKPDEGWLIGVPFIRDLTTGKPLPLHDLPEDVTKIPNQTNPKLMDEVFRFNPPTDAVKVTTFSMALVKAGKESLIEWLMSLAALSPPLTPILAQSVFEAAEDIIPAAGEIAARLRAAMPTPPADPTDAAEAPALVGVLQQQMQQMQQQMQELEKKAAPAEAAREVAKRNADKDVEIAKLRAQVEVYKANLAADVKRDELVVKQSLDYDRAAADREAKQESDIINAVVKSDDSRRQQEMAREGHQATAKIEGLKAREARETAKEAAKSKPQGDKGNGGSSGTGQK